MCNVNKDKILLILTGGTICSSENNDGKRSAHADEAKYKIVSAFRESGSPFSDVEFDYRTPLNILSENMNISSWNILLDDLRSIENINGYKGIILLHGTDTLAYTSSLLSFMLTSLEVPLILVSSQLPIDSEGTNAKVNFRAAAELIMNGIEPNVYAVYRNSDGNTYLHYGNHLRQCASFSDDFFSTDMEKITDTINAKLRGRPFSSDAGLLRKIAELKGTVLTIAPYVGTDYSCYNLQNVSAVIHCTYHSQTVCVEGEGSIVSLAEMCKKTDTDLFLAPCDSDSYKYVTTGKALESGAVPIGALTPEAAYAKVLAGCSLGLKGAELTDFINEEINGETII